MIQGLSEGPGSGRGFRVMMARNTRGKKDPGQMGCRIQFRLSIRRRIVFGLSWERYDHNR